MQIAVHGRVVVGRAVAMAALCVVVYCFGFMFGIVSDKSAPMVRFVWALFWWVVDLMFFVLFVN